MTRNLELSNLVRRWLAAALALLETEQIPMREVLKVTLTEDEMIFDSHYETEPDYGGLLNTHEDALISLQETAEIVSWITLDSVAGPALLASDGGTSLPAPDRAKHLLRTCLWTFVREYLRDAGVFSVIRPSIDVVFEYFERFIYDPDSIAVVRFVQFWNLSLDVDEIELEPGVVLRKMSKDEQMSALVDHLRFVAGPWYIPKAALEVRRSIGRRRVLDWDLEVELDRIEQAALVGLRLLLANPVGILCWRDSPSQPFSLLMERQASPTHEWRKYAGERYIVTPEVADQLRKYWPKLRQAELQDRWPEAKRTSAKNTLTDPVLWLAFRRLNYSYERQAVEDKLIDYWITLEALFVDNPQELLYRASLRIARFVGESKAERLALRDTLKKSYDLRSKVVHGQVLDVKQQARLQSVAADTGQALRRSLRLCLAQGSPPSVMRIDDDLLD